MPASECCPQYRRSAIGRQTAPGTPACARLAGGRIEWFWTLPAGGNPLPRPSHAVYAGAPRPPSVTALVDFARDRDRYRQDRGDDVRWGGAFVAQVHASGGTDRGIQQAAAGAAVAPARPFAVLGAVALQHGRRRSSVARAPVGPRARPLRPLGGWCDAVEPENFARHVEAHDLLAALEPEVPIVAASATTQSNADARVNTTWSAAIPTVTRHPMDTFAATDPSEHLRLAPARVR